MSKHPQINLSTGKVTQRDTTAEEIAQALAEAQEETVWGLRKSVKQAVKSEAMRRVRAQGFEARNYRQDRRMLFNLHAALPASVRATHLRDAVAVYHEAESRLAWAKRADAETLQTYDPTADEGWPA